MPAPLRSRLTKSEQMARVRSRDTFPERALRAALTRLGVRYRLHRKQLPGTPDIYISRVRLAIFVNGCFWHGHDCLRGRSPATNVVFWTAKIDRNVERDADAVNRLRGLGIHSATVWQCEIGACDAFARRVANHYHAAVGDALENTDHYRTP